jgi:hypothetical protein
LLRTGLYWGLLAVSRFGDLPTYLRKLSLYPCKVATGGSDLLGLLERIERGEEIILLGCNETETRVRRGESALPLGIVGIFLCQCLKDGENIAISGERADEIALRLEHVADLDAGDRELDLSLRIAGVLLRDRPGDG